MRREILRIAIAMEILGAFALAFLDRGSAEFYVDVLGMLVNGVVIVLILLGVGGKTAGR